jgi:hypothetical protein
MICDACGRIAQRKGDSRKSPRSLCRAAPAERNLTTPLDQFACSIDNQHGSARLAQNAVCRGGAVRSMPSRPLSKRGLTLILMFDNEISGYHMKDMALGAPMVGFVAAAVVDEAQLDVAEIFRVRAVAVPVSPAWTTAGTLTQLIAAIGIFSSFIVCLCKTKICRQSLNSSGRTGAQRRSGTTPGRPRQAGMGSLKNDVFFISGSGPLSLAASNVISSWTPLGS